MSRASLSTPWMSMRKYASGWTSDQLVDNHWATDIKVEAQHRRMTQVKRVKVLSDFPLASDKRGRCLGRRHLELGALLESRNTGNVSVSARFLPLRLFWELLFFQPMIQLVPKTVCRISYTRSVRHLRRVRVWGAGQPLCHNLASGGVCSVLPLHFKTPL